MARHRALLAAFFLIAATAHVHAAEPSILVLPLEHALIGDELIVRVRVQGDVARVTLWAMGVGDDLYRAIPMEPTGGGGYEARLSARPEGAPWQTYYVEASGRGSGERWSNGTAESPFAIQVAPRGGDAPAGEPRGLLIWALLGALPLFLLLRTVFQARKGQAEVRGQEPIVVDRARVLERLAVLRPADPQLRTATDREVEEDLFWFHLLGPLVDRKPADREQALRILASRSHAHPTDGRRVYGVPQLREQLQRVARMDPGVLMARPATAAAAPDREVARQSAGMSLVELLVAMALVAIVVGIGALYLQPLATPVTTGGQMLIASVEQTRAKAIHTTRVQRLRPISAGSLVVESADSCSSGAWTYDPRLGLDLPTQVTLTDTTWSVCFDRRGLSSANRLIVLQHPAHGSRTLELFKGGVMRWQS